MAEIERDGVESVSERHNIRLTQQGIPAKTTTLGKVLAERMEDPNMSHSMLGSQSSFVFGEQSQFRGGNSSRLFPRIMPSQPQ